MSSPMQSGSASSNTSSVQENQEDLISQFVEAGQKILDAEQQAELASLSSTSKLSSTPQLSRLRVVDTVAGIAGKVLLALSPVDGSQLVLGHREVNTGDYVEIHSNQTDSSRTTGIVWRITRESIVAAVESDRVDCEILDAKSVRVIKRGNDVTYQRQREALRVLSQARGHPVVDVMFGKITPTTDEKVYRKTAEYLNEHFGDNVSTKSSQSRLNDEQREAVCSATAANHLALIHGPPGTGKTATLSQAIIASVRVRGERILACAPSNIAADTLLERLLTDDPSLRCVRVGNPARLLDSVLENSLDNLLEEEFSGIGRQIRRDISIAQKTLWKSSSSRDERGKARDKLRLLRKEMRQREQHAMHFVLGRAQVVVTTCAGAFDDRIRKFSHVFADSKHSEMQLTFDACFFDEAATALEPLAWCAMIAARRCVLAGDDQQLPPTILTRDENFGRKCLNFTAFARARSVLEPSKVLLLRRQYRMNSVIAQFSSENFYNRMLIHDETVKDHQLKDLLPGTLKAGEPVQEHLDQLDDCFLTDFSAAIIFIDTCGCDMFESVEAGVADWQAHHNRQGSKGNKNRGKKALQNSHATAEEEDDAVSRLNEGEAGIAVSHVKSLVRSGISAGDIALISPYAAQCRRLRHLLSKENALQTVEVGTVDSYQGRENEAIVFSATRSSENGGQNGIGFLGDVRRFNVALTRARRSFTLIGDSATLTQHAIFDKFARYVEKRTLAEYRSAFSYTSY